MYSKVNRYIKWDNVVKPTLKDIRENKSNKLSVDILTSSLLNLDNIFEFEEEVIEEIYSTFYSEDNDFRIKILYVAIVLKEFMDINSKRVIMQENFLINGKYLPRDLLAKTFLIGNDIIIKKVESFFKCEFRLLKVSNESEIDINLILVQHFLTIIKCQQCSDYEKYSLLNYFSTIPIEERLNKIEDVANSIKMLFIEKHLLKSVTFLFKIFYNGFGDFFINIMSVILYDYYRFNKVKIDLDFIMKIFIENKISPSLLYFLADECYLYLEKLHLFLSDLKRNDIIPTERIINIFSKFSLVDFKCYTDEKLDKIEELSDIYKILNRELFFSIDKLLCNNNLIKISRIFLFKSLVELNLFDVNYYMNKKISETFLPIDENKYALNSPFIKIFRKQDIVKVYKKVIDVHKGNRDNKMLEGLELLYCQQNFTEDQIIPLISEFMEYATTLSEEKYKKFTWVIGYDNNGNKVEPIKTSNHDFGGFFWCDNVIDIKYNPRELIARIWMFAKQFPDEKLCDAMIDSICNSYQNHVICNPGKLQNMFVAVICGRIFKDGEPFSFDGIEDKYELKNNLIADIFNSFNPLFSTYSEESYRPKDANEFFKSLLIFMNNNNLPFKYSDVLVAFCLFCEDGDGYKLNHTLSMANLFSDMFDLDEFMTVFYDIQAYEPKEESDDSDDGELPDLDEYVPPNLEDIQNEIYEEIQGTPGYNIMNDYRNYIMQLPNINYYEQIQLPPLVNVTNTELVNNQDDESEDD